jgi:DNA-binding transcriptional LysR family regulator|tara:strand:+ start:2617 stop:3501 length:885 start_codon:yes stop_codon:yes gene_type:complete
MDLNGLVLFVEIIKQGSITRAGTVLGKPKSTLSRQLSEFEQALGVKLVERTTRRLDLTEAGRELYEQSKDLLSELGDIQHSIGAYQRQPKGQLTILWPQELFTAQMAELIAEFLQTWSLISFCGTQYNGATPAPDSQYDLQFLLHQQPLPASDWIGRSLMSIPHNIYIASHCLNRAPKTLDDIRHCQCILQSGEDEWLFRQDQQIFTIPVQGRLTLNSPDMRLQAAIRGLGAVRLANYLAEPYVRQGALTAVTFNERPVADTLSVLYRSRQLPLKTRLFLEHFQNHVGRLYSTL